MIFQIDISQLILVFYKYNTLRAFTEYAWTYRSEVHHSFTFHRKLTLLAIINYSYTTCEISKKNLSNYCLQPYLEGVSSVTITFVHNKIFKSCKRHMIIRPVGSKLDR